MTSNNQPWKKRMEIPDPQVQDAAEQYDDARLLLLRQPPGYGLLLPLFNAAAIAVELFLKSLSSKQIHIPVDGCEGYSKVYARPEVQNHKLCELFDKIPGDVRIRLESSYATNTSIQANPSLREILAKYEGLFAVSRYPFESKADLSRYPLQPLMALSAFLRKFVTNIEPVDRIEWQ